MLATEVFWAITKTHLSCSVSPARRFDSALKLPQDSRRPFLWSLLSHSLNQPQSLLYPNSILPPRGGMRLALHFAVLIWLLLEVPFVPAKIVIVSADHLSVTYLPSVCDLDCTRVYFQQWSVFRKRGASAGAELPAGGSCVLQMAPVSIEQRKTPVRSASPSKAAP
jgi:hypothetical protein